MRLFIIILVIVLVLFGIFTIMSFVKNRNAAAEVEKQKQVQTQTNGAGFLRLISNMFKKDDSTNESDWSEMSDEEQEAAEDAAFEGDEDDIFD